MATRRRNPFEAISDTPVDPQVLRLDEEGELNVIETTQDKDVIQYDIFYPGILGFTYFRIPSLVVTSTGTMIAAAMASTENTSETFPQDIVSATSSDGGVTWENYQVAMKGTEPGTNKKVVDPCMVVGNGDVIYLFGAYFSQNHLTTVDPTQQLWVCKSTNQGVSWSAPTVLSHLKLAADKYFLTGPGSGIKMSNGWLVCPAQAWYPAGNPNIILTTIIYSKDNGATWSRPANTGLPYDTRYTNGEGKYSSSEAMVVEYPKNTLMIMAKGEDLGGWIVTDKARFIYYSNDLGETWVPHLTNRTLRMTNGVQGCILKINSLNNQDRIIASCPIAFNTGTVGRAKVALHLLTTNDTEWLPIGTIDDFQTYGYTNLAFNPWNNDLYCLTEAAADRNPVNAPSVIRLFNITRYLGRITQAEQSNFRAFQIPTNIDSRLTSDTGPTGPSPFKARYQQDGVWIGGTLRINTKLPDSPLQFLSFPVVFSGPYSVANLIFCYGAVTGSNEVYVHLISVTVDKTSGQLSLSTIDSNGRTNKPMSQMDVLYFPNQKIGVFG